LVLALTASLVVACGGGEEPRLVFDSERDGDDDIYLMAADGSDVQQLTNEPGRDYEPDVSPDGKRIVFASQRASGDSSQLHIMDVDGTNVRRLTFSADDTADRVLDDYAEWSPDGTRITFQRTTIPESGRSDANIWLIDPETGEETPLTDAPDVWDSTPTFTTDGNAVIFESNRSGSFELYRQPLDGGEAVRLTEREGNEGEAKESPDGSLIAFVSDQDGDFDVYLMDAGGGNVRALTSAEGNDRCPQWSPDGKRIAFSSERDGNPEIYVMNADGSDQRRLTDTPAAEEVADWVRR
jgi:Tol biopolymer transport system component